jgi:hypothetical protein
VFAVCDQSRSHLSDSFNCSLLQVLNCKQLLSNRHRDKWNLNSHDNNHFISRRGFHKYTKHFVAHSTGRSKQSSTISSICQSEWFHRKPRHKHRCHTVRTNCHSTISKRQANWRNQCDRNRHQVRTDCWRLHSQHYSDKRAAVSFSNHYPNRSGLQDGRNPDTCDASRRKPGSVGHYNE